MFREYLSDRIISPVSFDRLFNSAGFFDFQPRDRLFHLRPIKANCFVAQAKKRNFFSRIISSTLRVDKRLSLLRNCRERR
jgi:hypothetical protein